MNQNLKEMNNSEPLRIYGLMICFFFFNIFCKSDIYGLYIVDFCIKNLTINWSGRSQGYIFF